MAKSWASIMAAPPGSWALFTAVSAGNRDVFYPDELRTTLKVPSRTAISEVIRDQLQLVAPGAIHLGHCRHFWHNDEVCDHSAWFRDTGWCQQQHQRPSRQHFKQMSRGAEDTPGSFFRSGGAQALPGLFRTLRSCRRTTGPGLSIHRRSGVQYRGRQGGRTADPALRWSKFSGRPTKRAGDRARGKSLVTSQGFAKSAL